MLSTLNDLPTIYKEREHKIDGTLNPETNVFELNLPKACPHAIYLYKTIDTESRREGV